MSSASPPRLRSPLSDNTNRVHSRSPTAFDTAKTTQSRHVRRKVSLRAFNPDADSSEDEWSDHGSIYTALRLSSSEALEIQRRVTSGERRKLSSAEDGSVSPKGTVSPGGSPITPLEKLIRPPGTPLQTIIEQKSIATLRAAQSFSRVSSLDNIVLWPAKSDSRALARRKQSFSEGDIAIFKVKESIQSSSESSNVDGVLPGYAEPKEPLFSPPYRMPTPPGMPPWTGLGPQAPRTSQPRTGRFFSLTNPHGWAHSSAMSRAGRFRPPASGHTSGGPLDSHPFHNAPLASIVTSREEAQEQMLMSGARPETLPVHCPSPTPADLVSRHVRFTSSVVGGDDTVHLGPYRNAATRADSATESSHALVQPSMHTGSSPIIQPPPLLNTRSPHSPPGSMPPLRLGEPSLPLGGGKWHKFWKRACCCCYYCFTDCCESDSEESAPPVFQHGRPIMPIGVSAASGGVS
ncbi:MAG: hypothetical protein M1812_004868 [Candelaria pacifica]|nr:MAG: hypothetical protein M1812_004868 [Candelaria pacifica]